MFHEKLTDKPEYRLSGLLSASFKHIGIDALSGFPGNKILKAIQKMERSASWAFGFRGDYCHARYRTSDGQVMAKRSITCTLTLLIPTMIMSFK